jgi:hypothetical protein
MLHEVGAEYRIALDDGEFLVHAERAGEEFLHYRLEPLPRDFLFSVVTRHPRKRRDAEPGGPVRPRRPHR